MQGSVARRDRERYRFPRLLLRCRAPSRIRDEERGKRVLGKRWHEFQALGWRVPPETCAKFIHAPRRHGTHVVVTAFNLVPWAAESTIVAISHCIHDIHGCIQLATLDQQARQFILYARPAGLVTVDDGKFRLVTPWPRGNEEGTLVFHGIHARLLLEPTKILSQVVFHDAIKRCIDMLGGHHFIKPQHVSPPLTE